MDSKPREIKILTILQVTLTLLSLITLGHMFTRPAPEAGYYPGGLGMIELFLFWVLVIGFILGLAISYGLWAGKVWARNWGTVYWVFSLLFGLLWIYLTVSSRLSGYTNPFIDGLLIIGIVYVFASLSNLYLATRPRVKDFFEYCRLAKKTEQKGEHVKPDASSTPEEHALLVKYQRKYPHNPEGVLEFHISRRMKEGKTRKQAVKELAKENE